MSNELARETSPYLLQHKDNPVDWHPWGVQALALARSKDLPILLSVGYAACHWCHVMERESFEDPDTARVMNEHFVCIKVDREERPDLDAIYMEAVQAMTGHGGWPMTVFLTPEGVPFYGGTYFPPDDRHGLPSFRRLLGAIAETWKTRRDEVESQGAKLIEHIGLMTRVDASEHPITDDLLALAAEALRNSADLEHGGLGAAPKFPQPMTMDLALRLNARGHEGMTEIVRVTLDRMAAGGMYDQLAGGFARYSVDDMWLVPHFEKMLYDNAQLLRTYARAHRRTGIERWAEVSRRTAEWMLAEMRDPQGGFWSSLDADSEGEEGRFYLWDLAEVAEVTGEDLDAAIVAYGFTERGNFEGRNIPIWTGDTADPVAVERARRALLARRTQRIRPATDDKVLAGWNGLAVAALAEAGAHLDPTWIAPAAEALGFVLEHMVVDGRLMRSYRAGTVKHLAYAEDYAQVLEGALSLFEATGGRKWLDAATWAADEAIRLFFDNERGGFFTTGSDAESLITRSKDLMDNAVPSANSVLALELQRLALITGIDRYVDAAESVLKLITRFLSRSPLAFGHALGAVDLYTSDALEIVVVASEGSDPGPLLDTVHDRFLPNRVIVRAEPGSTISPLLEARTEIEGRPTVYVCRNRTCKHPVTDPTELAQQLA